jgi:hypothetical protein
MQCEPNPWGVALSEPLRESNGFMSHAVTYAIRCAHLNSSVRRGVKDFEWLLQALKLRYRSGLFIPPTNTHAMGDAKNEEKVAQQERYLTLCLAAMTRHPVLSMDELVLLFLTEKMEVWKVYRKGKRKAPEGHLHLWDAGLRDHVVVREAAQGVISVMEKGERDSEVDARVAESDLNKIEKSLKKLKVGDGWSGRGGGGGIVKRCLWWANVCVVGAVVGV